MIEPVYTPSADRYENGMEYRRCGRSGIRLPLISLGLWHNFGSHQSMQNVKAMAHFAFDKGICHFDLANNYGPEYGTAEENFGRLMKESFAPYRDELFISTKAGHDMWPGMYGEWGSRKYLMASLDQSLRRMGLDYVDIFYSHRYDPDTPLEETLQALVDIVRQGKALYVGISKYPPEAARFAFRYLSQQHVPCLLFQGRYNIIDRHDETGGVLDLCQENGSGYIAFSPLQQGLLTNRYLDGIPEGSRMSENKFLKPEVLTPKMMEILRMLNDMARRRGQSFAQMSLSWLLQNPKVSSVIIGASSIGQIQDNLLALHASQFDEEERSAIDNISRPVWI